MKPLTEILGDAPRTVSLVRAIGPREHRSLVRALTETDRPRKPQADGSHLFGRFGLHPQAGWDR